MTTAVQEPSLPHLSSQKYERLKELLRELFQMNKPDLDFGIYRIMNAKRGVIEKFLDEDLFPQVREGFAAFHSEERARLLKQLEELKADMAKVRLPVEQSPDFPALKARLDQVPDNRALEDEVFSRLYDFFRRYYKDGDFISMRFTGREGNEKYAIPYNGEEVKLYWANHDQYYIKSSENLTNYAFWLDEAKTRRVRFELVKASTERDNNKEQKGKERRFVLTEEEPVIERDGELVLRFEYRPMETPKGKRDFQKELLADAARRVFEDAFFKGEGKLEWLAELRRPAPTEKDKERTLLHKHLAAYAAKNTADYFIHKDLGGFLRKELDFFLKNEVLHLDDLDAEGAVERASQALSKVRVIRRVAEKIIAFLAQLENFQKRLWLKKKFVVDAEWRAIPSRTLDLVDINTAIDQSTPTHLLINADNFAGVGLLRKRFANTIDCIYLDPPYNAPLSEVLYRNGYKHSSWLSMMADRLEMSRPLLSPANHSLLEIAIDENEQERLGLMLQDVFPAYSQTCISVVHNPRGIQGQNFSYCHEYVYILHRPGVSAVGERALHSNEWEASNLRNWGGESLRSDAKNCFYPIYVKGDDIIGFGDVADDNYHPPHRVEPLADGRVAVWPIDPKGVERKWRYARQSVEQITGMLSVVDRKDGPDIQLTKRTGKYKTVWTDSRYDAGTHGTRLLTDMGISGFSFPKSVHLVTDCVAASVRERPDAIVLDYFAGSGTTAHAVLNLNREDGGRRSAILVEMGAYFDDVLVPRVERAALASRWSSGVPQSDDPVDSLLHIIRLESYEDTLDNLALPDEATQRALLPEDRQAREDYVLRYMLDFETRGSLLNVEQFEDPFNYKLRITRDNETRLQTVDLVETFNFLIGLHVSKYHYDEKFPHIRAVEGVVKDGDLEQSVLVVWRNVKEVDDDGLRAWFAHQRMDPTELEFEKVYINGDTHLEAKRGGRIVVHLIEEDFHRLMFDVEDV